MERDLIHLEKLDAMVNMADLFTKSLQRATFHWHTDFVLGHIPPKYSPVHAHLVGTYFDDIITGNQYVPPSFTTPITLLQLKYVLLSKKIIRATRGCRSYGMISTIHHYTLWIVGGCYCRYVDMILLIPI